MKIDDDFLNDMVYDALEVSLNRTAHWSKDVMDDMRIVARHAFTCGMLGNATESLIELKESEPDDRPLDFMADIYDGGLERRKAKEREELRDKVSVYRAVIKTCLPFVPQPTRADIEAKMEETG